ncbi:ABC transporter ATP-binding protein [Arthrobacter agilis]|uniref:ABC transporter ATP-binding protein n=1 Tax=Arthrobacter agilis TaxID=37921 RepID=UPI000B34C4DE|nr:ABC transporter ATP-binding protein [Arthrobacter agilis]OUM41304.1 ABC transporter ATP-binding protein [Arthrobacter agilis]PPB46363.1 ABC transporter ATP-binding protein [Arthrobacter agilis]TPV27122.1 ABC transporter ATP-binding protein [Arthrobacter agilis]VDR32708.1 Lipid A export ATP-binding/permease protein MsbA [Arthrobacter agilis]
MNNLLATLRPLLATLPAGSRRFLIGYGIATACLSLLDIISLGLIAVLLPSLVGGASVELPIIGSVASQTQLLTLLGIACALVVAKGVFAVLILRSATARFAKHEVAIGDRLLASYLSSPWEKRLQTNSSELVRAVDVGVGLSVAGVLIPAMTLFGEIGTLIAVGVVLAVAQPAIAVVSIVYLALVALLLARVISPLSVRMGQKNLKWSAKTVKILTEALAALKEITLADRAAEVRAQVHETRTHSSAARANSVFLAQVPRYVLESALIVGFILVGGVGFATGGTEGAVSAVGLFAVAGFRLVPSLTRLQAVQSQVNSNSAFAQQVVADIRESEQLLAETSKEHPQHDLGTHHVDIVLHDVTFTYPGAGQPALRGVSATIPAGSHVAFVGSSGAGKSTIVDILLGLLKPTSGHVEVDSERMDRVMKSWRKRIGYVPQDVSLFDASVGQNVALSWDPDNVDHAKVEAALRRAQMYDVIMNREGGRDALIAERGLALSGGQRQRLGIARALYNEPDVLVMDEATSALDTATESAVTTAIRELHGQVTVITVAHRLSTIRSADIVFFMQDGRIVAQGTFDEVVAKVPDFARQAQLAGLS